MDNDKLFVYSHTKGNIDYYNINPDYEIYIPSINIETGEIEEKRITQYTIHKNLTMYRIEDPENRFKTFWVSDDHSMIVIDKRDKNIKKISPVDIIKKPHFFYLVKYDRKTKKTEHINCNELIIELDKTKTEAADFTVEDNYTFCTDDGIFVQDTMAIYVPMTKEAQDEIKQKMIMPTQGHKVGSQALSVGQGLVIGMWMLTKDPDSNMKPIPITEINFNDDRETILKNMIKKFNYRFNIPTIVNNKITTFGRFYLKMLLPKEVQHLMENKLYKKKDILKLFNDIIKNIPDKKIAGDIIENIVRSSFKIYSYFGYSMNLDTIEVKEKIKEYKEKLKNIDDATKQIEIIDKLKAELKELIKKSDPDFYDLVESGAAKGWDQVFNLLGVKGFVGGLEGNIELVAHGIADGFNSITFFKGGNPARMGLGNRALSTAKSGYLTRKLIYAMNSVVIDSKIRDCNTDMTLQLKVTKDIASRLHGRYIVENGVVRPIVDPSAYIGKIINLRSPIYCKAKNGICEVCYGKLLNEIQTTKIGILAAQILGERATNLLMKSFHTGGTVKIEIIDILDLITKTNLEIKKEDISIYLKQEETKILVTKPYYLEIDKTDYMKGEYSIQNDEESGLRYLHVDYLIATLVDGDKRYKLYANIPIKLFASEMKKTDYGYLLEFNRDDYWEIEMSLAGEMNAVISTLLSLIESKNKIDNPYYLLMEIYRLYEDATDADFVHFELIVSQLMRNPDNISIPARLVRPYKAICVGIKNIPYAESWINGILFENFNKAIAYGFTQESQSKDTPLSDLFFNNI